MIYADCLTCKFHDRIDGISVCSERDIDSMDIIEDFTDCPFYKSDDELD